MIPILIALLMQAPAVTPPAVKPHDAALEQYKKHAYTEAAASFRTALETEKPGTPEYQESILLLAHSLFLTNHVPEAIPYLEKAQRSDEVLYMLGTAYVITRDPKKAEAVFAPMYGVGVNSAAVHLLAAQMMMRQEHVDEAEAELQQALALEPKLPQAHYILGEIRLVHGNADQAVDQFKQEIALNPDSSTAYYKLGDAYTRRSEWPAAVSSLQKSIWLNPDFSGPYILLGRSYLKLGQAANAEGVLRHAVQVDPRNYSAHYLLGQTLMQEGRTDEGRQMLEESQKLKSK